MPAKKTAPPVKAPTAEQKLAAKQSLLAVEKAQKELDLRLRVLDRRLKAMSIHGAGS
jgi:hypothetical protein